jgi:cysteine peptidase C11 family protein
MNKKHIFLLLMVIACVSMPLFADTWKIFWYMDSSDALSDMAIKNMTDMMRGKPNDKVDCVIQLHAYYQSGLRYHVTENGLEFLEEITLTGDSKKDFINAADWAFMNNDADHTMLILANHGFGILDPQWNEATKEWEMDTGSLSQCGCVIKSIKEHKRHRGFMFSTTPRVYLNNNDLVDGLAIIKKNILGDKKIDILAFDTCMGDMFEVAYLVAPYAHYLVGNQSCSLLDGFDYQGVTAVLNQGLPARDVAVGMVDAFDAYYDTNDASGIYTHAALDLSKTYAVSSALDNVVDQLLNMPTIAPLLVQARDASPRFCLWPMYTDLIAFCKLIELELSSLQPSDELSATQNALTNFYTEISSLIVARCGGFTTQDRAYGVAIYLPWAAIDSSYYTTSFSQKSQWINLLELIASYS